MERELKALGNLITNPGHPFGALLGGAKVSDKISLIQNILDKVDLLLIGGGIQLFESLKCKGWKSILFHVLIAVLYILVGIEIIARPMMASAFLTLLLAGGIILVGIVRIVMGIQLCGLKNWVWPLLSGIISVFLGLIIAAKWPVSGLFVIGLFVAIELIIHGWSYIFIALAAKGAVEISPAEA